MNMKMLLLTSYGYKFITYFKYSTPSKKSKMIVTKKERIKKSCGNFILMA